ncbi:MAG: hypothetical protein PUP91_28910 [Rhizonema sp. PD37]|nr:hypothetical protein [Rhizonema sp. PD37]
MSTLDFLVAINGIGQLWATDGQFLGLLSSDQNDLNSINNLYGVYGSQNGLYSIRNSCSIYGGQYGLYSPYNVYCHNPPIIFYLGQPAMIVTKNVYAQTNGLTVIDPDLLLGVYAQNGTIIAGLIDVVCGNVATTGQTDIVQAQLEALTHRSQTNADMINRVMQSTSALFR